MVQYVWGQFWVNNHAHVLSGARGYTTEHLRVLLDHVNIRPFVTGAVQPELNQGNLKSVPAAMAPRPVVEEFGNTIAPAFQLLRVIEDESRKLAAMRDYLLPKLLSGELRVKDAATTVEELF
jgi:type I restriction enzyme S subunit